MPTRLPRVQGRRTESNLPADAVVPPPEEERMRLTDSIMDIHLDIHLAVPIKAPLAVEKSRKCGFLSATKHLYDWLCPLVGRSVGRVTYSFDDPLVAPYWPTWPC